MLQTRKRPDTTWLTAMAEYEGQPLALRVRPRADSAANRAAFQYLVTLSHQLAVVTSNGLPEATYNESLFEFDADVHRCLEGDGHGLVVLVETSSGERNYYAYVAEEAGLKTRVEELSARYPRHVVSVRVLEDPDWGFYTDYRNEFPW